MALFKGSFYERVALFQPDESGRTVFKGIGPRPLGAPDPVLEHSVALMDRLDSVAQHYYADPRYWRRFADANPQALFAEDLIYGTDPVEENGRERVGEVVLIPRKRDGA